MISYKLLEGVNACERGLLWYKESYGEKEYTIDEIIKFSKKNNINPDYKDVRWLIENCKFAQTSRMLKFYISLNPNYKDVSWLIRYCEFAQTSKMLELYKSLNPDYSDVRWLIAKCKVAQTLKNQRLLFAGL